MANVIETPPKMVTEALEKVEADIERDFDDHGVAWAGASGAALYAAAQWADYAGFTEEDFLNAAKIEWERAQRGEDGDG